MGIVNAVTNVRRNHMTSYRREGCNGHQDFPLTVKIGACMPVLSIKASITKYNRAGAS